MAVSRNSCLRDVRTAAYTGAELEPWRRGKPRTEPFAGRCPLTETSGVPGRL
ncbi:hypothetical protein SLNWT_5155 [Streptomyces albus]|uniref:Uncharacterized protein n=1 Tax=Streptomyces albus (strain ATCC 21838 / DSM 41398 / FERM P-419 / JCM 4703 / NBRC 107858) TaxID=1081613 RepID=A0A0B5F3P3_STRA4|nr:hypothetical protein SLNWT_5155 [Streptomyces albus]AOU79835.1 hypothetical protein SLNHY_5144 [Streptomyces albus]AYN35558.1 hypothetical protein DUI70_5060 [Streptomyces albus]